MIDTSHLKILMIFSQPWHVGGAETHFQTLVQQFTQRNIPVIIAGFDKTIVQQFSATPVYQMPFRSSNPLIHINNYLHLKHIIQKHNIQIIHTHHRTGSVYAWLINRNLKIPYIVTFHDKWRALHKIYKPFLPNRCIAISEGIKTHFINQFGLSNENIQVIKNGVVIKNLDKKTPSFQSCTETQLFTNAKNDHIILHVSRFSHKKAEIALLLCNIVKELNDRLKKRVILVLAGQGDREDMVRTAAQSANRACGHTVVYFLGPRRDIDNLLTYSTIAVGAGRFALEAMAVGKPVYAIADGTNCPGLINEDNWMNASDSSWTRGNKIITQENLLQDIQRLLDNKPLQDRLGQFGHQLIKNFFNAEIMAEGVLNEYQMAMH